MSGLSGPCEVAVRESLMNTNNGGAALHLASLAGVSVLPRHIFLCLTSWFMPSVLCLMSYVFLTGASESEVDGAVDVTSHKLTSLPFL